MNCPKLVRSSTRTLATAGALALAALLAACSGGGGVCEAVPGIAGPAGIGFDPLELSGVAGVACAAVSPLVTAAVVDSVACVCLA